ncbi:MAG: winged helix-turn-helix transcriptional regulator, partial [Clostridia bacterium]|nr:winged helix-turn-helix transcriptional regulator [Clostridia bacterium]
FGKRSIARNSIIADLLARTHYIEKSGTGIGRMREDMKIAGLKEPIFEYDGFFEVVLLRPSYYDKNYGTYDLAKKDIIEKEKLNNTQIQILSLIKDNPSITQKEMAEKIGMALPTIRKNVQILKNKGILIREGATKKGIWIVK